MKIRNSLLTKYLLIISAALVLWPIVLPVYYLPKSFLDKDSKEKIIYMDTQELERMWQREAEKLDGATSDKIDKRLRTLKKQYSKAMIFWVDGSGKTKQMLPNQRNIPNQWTIQESVQFMKKSVGTGPFTIVAYIGGDSDQGFMVFQVPHSLTDPLSISVNEDVYLLLYGFLVFVLFLFISWLFFSKIRRRLVQLQTAMTEVGVTGLPNKVTVMRLDEIGQLGISFNHMIDELTKSRNREQEEEVLRKQLIANISHDLRTPLTTIRGHAYSLKKESLSLKGQESLYLIESKVDMLSRLLDNLLAYTLLSAGKYTMERKMTDMVRLLRSSLASWYPVFEKEGFEVNVRLPDQVLIWNIDPQWFTRVLDNLFQNVVRHAKTGRYISVHTEEQDEKNVIIIEDKGPGMNAGSQEKGAEIGLSIVSLMLKEMNLDWKIESSSSGTRIYVFEKS
ncbi:HAMP domain-containing sensor histidine kinase [Neobacillus mesonae]|uniref:histidine kinase n=1 Tax=Neobacillus mesonae TaxID=1193713 RepID=A0A3Q9QQH9_9BACI|nr:histidine kinase dimerization/phospho-acceptor domain-containing protein [Neobacillus mesonae]AZU60750.1 two-component sensor histidine kinase [Neobacillus mesonae]